VPVFKELQNFLPKKFVTKLSKYGFGIRDPEKTYSGFRIRVQGSKKHQIPEPDPQQCLLFSLIHFVASFFMDSLSSLVRVFFQLPSSLFLHICCLKGHGNETDFSIFVIKISLAQALYKYTTVKAFAILSSNS
jgi:hypothetical protein